LDFFLENSFFKQVKSLQGPVSTVMLIENQWVDVLGDAHGSHLVSVRLALVDSVPKHLVFMFSKHPDQLFCAFPVDDALEGDIIIHGWQDQLVKIDHLVQTALADVERTDVRKEVIADEKTEENEVVNYTLQIPWHPQLADELAVFELEVLSEKRNVD
jgi:hypothetical protein